MRLQAMNSLYSLDDLKQYLIKYCYFNSTPEGLLKEKLTRVLIQECSDKALLLTMKYYFDNLVYPYFDVHRSIFNKLRNFFMTYCLSLFLQDECISATDTSDMYKYWCKQSGVSTCRATMSLNELLSTKLNKVKEQCIEIYTTRY